jgi:hypothetical protein
MHVTTNIPEYPTERPRNLGLALRRNRLLGALGKPPSTAVGEDPATANYDSQKRHLSSMSSRGFDVRQLDLEGYACNGRISLDSADDGAFIENDFRGELPAPEPFSFSKNQDRET